MTPISDALKDLLGRQGLTAREGLAGPVARGMDAGERMHSAAHPAIGRRPGGQTGPMGMGKTRATKARASFQEVGEIVSQEPSMARSHPVPHVVVDNSRCKPIHTPTRVAPRGIGFHLVLIEGGKR